MDKIKIQQRLVERAKVASVRALTKAMKHRNRALAQRAIQGIVEMILPSRGHLRDRVVHNQNGNPHMTWYWPTSAGKANLVVEVVGHEWDAVRVSLWVSYPAIQRRDRMVYRNLATPETAGAVVEHALHQLSGR